MILPPLPQGYENKPWDYKGPIWIESQMQAYGERCIKEYKAAIVKRLTGRTAKFSADTIAKVRAIRDSGEGYKKANRLYPMDRHTYFRIVGHKGAYK